MKSLIHIGTSGWHYKHWKGTFYPKEIKLKDHFSYYLNFFDTIEINNTFYRLPSKETFIKWHNTAPKDFIYAVKASRYITHLKKLQDISKSENLLLQNASFLKKHLGPILFQLPPGWEINIERFKNFLEILPKKYRYVFEFRNKTWYNETIYGLLQQHNAAFCIYELAGQLSPIKITADFVYVRLHGPDGKYQGSYDDDTLIKWAEYCKIWLAKGKEVFIYFDNDEKGYAAFNAIRLKELLNI
jgi:uncharacterized protein YecE (DUF72 family)